MAEVLYLSNSIYHKIREEILFIDEMINKPYDKENRDTMRVFTLFEIVKNDTVQCISDLKLRSRWSYWVTSNKHAPYGAKYTAEITDDDF